MNIQYFHKRIYNYVKYDIDGLGSGVRRFIKAKGGTTIALQVPTIEQFNGFEIKAKDHWGFYPSIELEFGISKCSSDDNYNKKIGRNITKGRMKTIVFFARKYNEDEVILSDSQGKYPELILRKSPQGGKVHFVGVNK